MQALHHPLHERRRIDEPECPVAVDKAVHQVFQVAAFGVHGDVTDALAGQSQVFGVGGNDDALGVVV